ncbi:hypothetical protein GQ457_02G001350 [Hibiscus cannabinus]
MTVNRAAEGSIIDEIKTELDAIDGHSGQLRRRRRRTTLAELFSEDSDPSMKKKPSSLEPDTNSCRKGWICTKQGEDSRPIKMLNQVSNDEENVEEEDPQKMLLCVSAWTREKLAITGTLHEKKNVDKNTELNPTLTQ